MNARQCCAILLVACASLPLLFCAATTESNDARPAKRPKPSAATLTSLPTELIDTIVLFGDDLDTLFSVAMLCREMRSLLKRSSATRQAYASWCARRFPNNPGFPAQVPLSYDLTLFTLHAFPPRSKLAEEQLRSIVEFRLSGSSVRKAVIKASGLKRAISDSSRDSSTRPPWKDLSKLCPDEIVQLIRYTSSPSVMRCLAVLALLDLTGRGLVRLICRLDAIEFHRVHLFVVQWLLLDREGCVKAFHDNSDGSSSKLSTIPLVKLVSHTEYMTPLAKQAYDLLLLKSR